MSIRKFWRDLFCRHEKTGKIKCASGGFLGGVFRDDKEQAVFIRCFECRRVWAVSWSTMREVDEVQLAAFMCIAESKAETKETEK